MIGLPVLEEYNSIKQKKILSSNVIYFLIQRVALYHMKRSEMRFKKTWKFQILQLPIYKMKG